MSYSHQDQLLANHEAMQNPQPGDYWHEMFCPYFLVVQVSDEDITVLNCLPRHGVSARQDVEGGWQFDVSKAMVVDRQWIQDRVLYNTIPGFVADVVRGQPRHQATVDAWVEHHGRELVKELKKLGPALSQKLLMSEW